MAKIKKIISIVTTEASMESFMLPEAIALQHDGWESIVITNFSDRFLNQLPPEMRYYSIPMERNYNLSTALKSIWRMYRIFRMEKPDLVQYGTTHAALFGSIAAKMAGVPARIFLQWGPTGYGDYVGVKRYLLKQVEVGIGWLNNYIRTVSRKNLLQSAIDGLYPSDKAKVVGEGGTIGVDLTNYDLSLKHEYRKSIRAKYGISDKDRVFLFVGRLCIPKGINELLSAFQKVRKAYPCKLMLVGPEESSLDSGLMDWAKKSTEVIFTGSVNHCDVKRFYCATDVLVQPTYREGFGMSIQEAMAMEIPVITTDIPGPSEVIENGESGQLVTVKDIGSLASAMSDSLNNPKKWIEYGKKGRKRVEKYFDRKIRLQLLVEDKNQIYNEIKR